MAKAVIAKLRAAAKEHYEAATRPISRTFTHLEVRRRCAWLERGVWLETIANDLEGDNLTYGLHQTIGQEEERTKKLLERNEDG